MPSFVEPACTVSLAPSPNPVSQVAFHPTLPLLLLQTSDRTINTLRIRTREEVEAKRGRRQKREREKGRKKEDQAVAIEDEADGEAGPVKWEDRLQAWSTIRTNAKIRSFDLGDSVMEGKSIISVSDSSLLTPSHVNARTDPRGSVEQLA